MPRIAMPVRAPWEFWVWAFHSAILTAGAIWLWIRKRQAPSWPSTQGTIWTATVDEDVHGNRLIPNWSAEFTYSYTVNGEYYSGLHKISARTRRRAEEKVEGWKGRSVVVRYHPKQHSFSLLLPGDQVGGQLGN